MIEKLVRLWVEKADKDLKLSKKELKTEDPIYEYILFHCQQAVEKYLKAFLTIWKNPQYKEAYKDVQGD